MISNANANGEQWLHTSTHSTNKKLIKLNQSPEMKRIGIVITKPPVHNGRFRDLINPTWILLKIALQFLLKIRYPQKKTHAPSTMQTSTKNPDLTCIPQRKWSPSRWGRNAHHWVTLPGSPVGGVHPKLDIKLPRVLKRLGKTVGWKQQSYTTWTVASCRI